jgi:hypothetical protein
MGTRKQLPYGRLLSGIWLALSMSAGPLGCGPETATTSNSNANPIFAATLSSPNGPEASAYIALSGTGIVRVTAQDARVFSNTQGNTTHVVLVREQPGLLQFRVEMKDASSVPTGSVIEVAGGDNKTRTDLSKYRLEISQ